MGGGEGLVRKVNSLITGEIGIDGADYLWRTKRPRCVALCLYSAHSGQPGVAISPSHRGWCRCNIQCHCVSARSKRIVRFRSCRGVERKELSGPRARYPATSLSIDWLVDWFRIQNDKVVLYSFQRRGSILL